MLKEEFLKLTGACTCPDEEFAKVNNAYMELEDMDKEEFCKLLMSRPQELMDKLVDKVRSFRQQTQFYKSQVNSFAEKIIEQGDFLSDGLYEKAKLAYGEANTIKYKIVHGYELNQEEQDYVNRNLHYRNKQKEK